ncbi:MAG: hypothetical protein JSS87_07080 [Acidobacteria bacterium]|nr:hypothetical protein [Acidobacteriota bacterium]
MAQPPIVDVLAHLTGGNTSGGEIRETVMRKDGYFHLDTPRMIARLKQMHANTYNYMIWNSPSDWDDLQKEFLPAAQKAHINVWIYLVPPTESRFKYAHPFRVDYVRWASELAKLSLRYPCLQAWAIDDFFANFKLFTPEYVKQLQQTAHSINPNFRFYPDLQLDSLDSELVSKYAPYIDGIIAPYIDMPYYNTQRTNSLRPQITAANKVLEQWKLPLYVLIYVGRHLGSPLEPTPQYAHDAIQIAESEMRNGHLAGIISYGTPLETYPARTRTNEALDGNGRLSLEVTKYPNKAGDWAQASQTVRIDPKSPKYWLSFWHYDRWGEGDHPKCLVKEVLIDDKVMWSADPAGDTSATWFDGGSLEGTLDLTNVLKDKKTAKLTLRLRTLQNFSKLPLDVSFDRLTARGFTITDPRFETGKGWKVSDIGGAMLAAIDHYDPNTFRELFTTVSTMFGRYQHPVWHSSTHKSGVLHSETPTR